MPTLPKFDEFTQGCAVAASSEGATPCVEREELQGLISQSNAWLACVAYRTKQLYIIFACLLLKKKKAFQFPWGNMNYKTSSVY